MCPNDCHCTCLSNKSLEYQWVAYIWKHPVYNKLNSNSGWGYIHSIHTNSLEKGYESTSPSTMAKIAGLIGFSSQAISQEGQLWIKIKTTGKYYLS